MHIVVMLHNRMERDMIGEVKCMNEKCGKVFIGTSRAKYCSKKCQMAYLRSKKRLEENGIKVKQESVGGQD